MASTSSSKAQEMLVKLSTDGVPKLFCPICNKAHISLAGYVKHLKKHEPPGGFCCRYCEDRFCSEEDLKKHLETQHITIACRLCKDTTFTNAENYRNHIRDIHNGIDRELYKCEKCGAAYKTLEPYRRHIATECGSIKPHKCDQCDMAFVTKYNLKQHIETHSSELKFCCSYCGRNFRMKARLVEHERTHTGEKPYKCDVCGKSFSHRESIVTHSSIHTGVRLVECRCCSSRFSCYSNLIKHRRNRPETCGLPEYDPPRNRIRKHTSRIPAVLNPTSEIRVVNVNKIIKPDHLEKANVKAKNKPTARKSTGRSTSITAPKPATKRKIHSKPAVIEFEDSDDGNLDAWLPNEDNESDEWPENNEEVDKVKDYKSPKAKTNLLEPIKRPKRKTKPLKTQDYVGELNTELVSTKWSDNSEDEYVPEMESEDDDSDNEESLSLAKDLGFNTFSASEIKQETDEMLDVTTNIQIEPLNDFEFSTLNSSGHVTVKSEYDDDENIFKEKDKILECLLNENDYSRLECETKLMAGESNAKKWRRTRNFNQVEEVNHKYLQETEVVLVKNEGDENNYPMEDILDIKKEFNANDNPKECFVLVEDITHRFPELKKNGTIKVPRNVQPFFSQSVLIKNLMRRPKRSKYRKRSKKTESAGQSEEPKRPRVTAEQLRERLKMIKKRDKVYQCGDCIKMYHMRKPYERHLREDHKKTVEEMREIFKDENATLDLDNVFKCHICDKIYLMPKRLRDHIPKHGPDGSLIHKCPCYCPKFFATRADALAHAQQAHRDQLWCEICQKFLNGVDTLRSHNIRSHGADKNDPAKWNRNLVCDKCGKKFMGRTQLTDHVRSDCGRVPIYQCQVCGKCLTTAGILKTHMLLHQDERPFQCDQCGKAFKIKAQYKSHIQFAHSDVKRFTCHLCPKAYPYRESLLTHMAVHTGIKRFLCNGCGKRFTCVSNLQAHRKVHAETCGRLPLNAKATQYMGVQKGNLLLGSKPEPGLDYVESQTLLAKDIYTSDSLHDIQTKVVQPSDTLSGGLPLNYTTNDLMLS